MKYRLRFMEDTVTDREQIKTYLHRLNLMI